MNADETRRLTLDLQAAVMQATWGPGARMDIDPESLATLTSTLLRYQDALREIAQPADWRGERSWQSLKAAAALEGEEDERRG